MSAKEVIVIRVLLLGTITKSWVTSVLELLKTERGVHRRDVVVVITDNGTKQMLGGDGGEMGDAVELVRGRREAEVKSSKREVLNVPRMGVAHGDGREPRLSA